MEAHRCSMISQDELFDSIKEGKFVVSDINRRYESEYKHNEQDSVAYKKWLDSIVPIYRENFDRLLIASKVCHALHKNDKCKIDDDLWSNNSDLRGSNFLREFSDELDIQLEAIVKKHESRSSL